MRAAFSSMAWNTGSSSPGELEMTCSTSEVAVCCSSDSVSSRVRCCSASNSRTFSIAITAWSAKVVDQLDLLVGERPHFVARQTRTPIGVPSRMSGTPSTVRKPPIPLDVEQREIRIGQNVGNVDGLPSSNARPTIVPRPGFSGAVRMTRRKLRRESRSLRRAGTRHPSGVRMARGVGLAQARRRFDQRVEHRLQIEGRAADDLEHVGGGGLLLQRFAQLVEQARVLDGDDGLGGEVLDQLDLLVGERAHLLAIDGEDANQFVLLEHRHRDDRTCAAKPRHRHPQFGSP